MFLPPCRSRGHLSHQAKLRALSSIIKQTDPLLIASREATELFLLLSDTFQLPVAWPLTDYGGFLSGGVAVGNVNLEIPLPVKKEIPYQLVCLQC